MRALCPECGKPMRWNRELQHWDCGPPPHGHGLWDPAHNTFDYERTPIEKNHPANHAE